MALEAPWRIPRGPSTPATKHQGHWETSRWRGLDLMSLMEDSGAGAGCPEGTVPAPLPHLGKHHLAPLVAPRL